MNIPITGGAGEKGKSTIRLLKKGHRAMVFDRFIYGHERIMHLVENRNLTLVKRDIRVYIIWRTLLKVCDR